MNHENDADFAKRVGNKDPTVLAEIDLAYSDTLRRRLRRFRGPFLNEQDIEDIVQAVLLDLLETFKESDGVPVRVCYFRRGKALCQDHLRRAYRRELREQIRASRTPDVTGPDVDPLQALIDLETKTFRRFIGPLIDAALLLLSDRQRKAYDHRFGKGGTQWARDLAKTAGNTPEYWRKASDEAVKSIGRYLKAHGVREKGGRYEVAS